MKKEEAKPMKKQRNTRGIIRNIRKKEAPTGAAATEEKAIK